MNFARRDAADKLRGRTRYTIDRYLPGMLHAVILRAEVPSGRILRLDIAKATRMPGVRAVVTAADAPGMIGIGIADHPLFARDVIRYDGEPIAVALSFSEARGPGAGQFPGRGDGRSALAPSKPLNARHKRSSYPSSETIRRT
jgi:CO/xanthine dehydrogenase Mo-binding subunit